jgi:hypothetical protein
MDDSSTLPGELQAFADEEARLTQMMLRGQQLEEKGEVAEGRAMQRRAERLLLAFYKEKLPEYRDLSGGG